MCGRYVRKTGAQEIAQAFSAVDGGKSLALNFNISPNNIAKSLLRYNVDKWKNLIVSGKKVCFLWGMEKLNISNREGNNYLKFSDRYDNVLSPIVQRNYNNGWYDEFFSITPDLPELMIKQCNIIKNFFLISKI